MIIAVFVHFATEVLGDVVVPSGRSFMKDIQHVLCEVGATFAYYLH